MKNIIKKPFFRRAITTVLVLGLIISGISFFRNGTEEETPNEEITKNVSIRTINTEESNNTSIETIGTVEAETSIDLISTTNGTLKGLYFEVGDNVALNQTMALLRNNTTLTGLNNAQTNLNNSQANLSSTERIANESIRQAEIGVEQAEVGVENAQKSIDVAEIGYKTAQDNLDNAIELQKKRVEDQKAQALINFNSYLNTLFNAEDQVGKFIKEDSPSELDPGIGAKDHSLISRTLEKYRATKDKYEELAKINPEVRTIEKDLDKMVEGLNMAEDMLDSSIKLLDMSVPTNSYPQSSIDAQKSAFLSLRANVIQVQNAAKAETQAISTATLTNSTELDGLRNALSSAEAQLTIAQTAKDNAELALKNAKQSLASAKSAKEQQILGAKTQIDNAKGQLNISQTQAADLNIKAPISGKVTQKYVEIGAELNPGSRIAEISQVGRLKIVVYLASEDIYRIELGQKVSIENQYEATIASISPAADPVSKKVKVEIIYDNNDSKLLQGTFVDVTIPVKQIERSNENSVYIPLRALTITQNEKFIFLHQDGRAIKRLVETGNTEGTLIEIVTGLNDGDELIVEGAKLLEDGEEVSVNN